MNCTSRSFFLWLVFLFVGPSISYAQNEVKYQQYTSEKGLSENVVYSLYKDKRGFIWIGTDYGLNRFDGYQYKKYFHIAGDTTSLSSNSILALVENSDGKIWVGTYDGLNLFNPVTGLSKRIPNPYNRKKFVSDRISMINKDELLVHSSGSEIFIYHVLLGTWKQLYLPPNTFLLDTNPFQLPDKMLAFCCTNKLIKGTIVLTFDSQNKVLQLKKPRNIFPFLRDENLRNYFYLEQAGEHIVLTESSTIEVYSRSGKLVTALQTVQGSQQRGLTVYDMARIDSASIWLATNLGLVIYNSITQNLVFAKLKGESQILFGNNDMRSLLNDDNGNVWIGMFGEGLLRTRTATSKFSNILLADLNGKVFQQMVFGLYQWQGDTVAAETSYGNFILLHKDKVVRRLYYEDFTIDKIVSLSTGKSFDQLNKGQKQLLSKLFNERALIPFRFSIPNSTTVISIYAGVTVYRNNELAYSNNTIPGNLIEDDHYFWISSDNGLLRLDKETLQDSVYSYRGGDPVYSGKGNLYHIALDGRNDIWAGTKGDGLVHFNRVENAIERFTTKDGLPDNVIYMILPDRAGNLWLTTNNGISRFNIQTRAFTNFSRQDGLLNTEFNRQGGLLNTSGMIYLTGTSGVDFFEPASLISTSPTAKVHIAGLLANGEEVTVADEIKLRHDQNNISILYTANSFARPDLVYYRYRAQGIINGWERVQGKNQLDLYALAPNNYIVEIQASLNNSDWSDTAIVRIRILHPWWQQWWFKLLLIVTGLLLGVLAVASYIRAKLLKKQHLFEKQIGIIKERDRIIADLHDDVGATLSSMHIYGDLADSFWDSQPEKSKDMVGKISGLSKELMTRMSDIVWSLKSPGEEKNSFTPRLKNYTQDLLSGKGIAVNFDINETVAAQISNPLARKNILLIAKEAINNIAKYSCATETVISLNLLGEAVELMIRDNGKGFDLAQTPIGNGLGNITQRCKQLNGKCEFKSAPGQGVSLVCRFPVAIISHTG